jgi:hypothetical protein
MTATGLFKLRVLPPKQNVTAKYYQENILDPFLLGNVNRTSDTGPVTDRRFHENTWDLIFSLMELQFTQLRALKSGSNPIFYSFGTHGLLSVLTSHPLKIFGPS